MFTRDWKGRAFFGILSLAVLGLPAASRADVISASGSSDLALGVYEVGGALTENRVNVSASTGAPPVPYDIESSQPADFLLGPFSGSATMVKHSLTSSVDGSGGPKLTTTETTITDFQFDVGTILSFSGDSLRTRSSVSGDAGAFGRTTELEGSGLSLTVLGNAIALPAGGSDGTVFVGEGITVFFGRNFGVDSSNAQGGITGLGVYFDDYTYNGTSFNGFMEVGTSYSSMRGAVPEPTTGLAVGAALGYLARRKRRTAK